MITQIILVSVSQFIMIFLKTYSVMTIQKRERYKTTLVSFGIQAAWLVSTSLGVKAMLENNYVVIAVYLTSGSFGSFVSFKKGK